MHKPSIAQVHGNCLAGGTDLAMACDIVIAADDAKIGFPAARAMGALPNNLWVYHCGPQWAKRLQMTGDCISGSDAERIGLVMKAVPTDVLEDEVEGLADRLSLIDPDLLAANKRITNLSMELMGAQTLQRLAGENDARAHRSRQCATMVAALKNTVSKRHCVAVMNHLVTAWFESVNLRDVTHQSRRTVTAVNNRNEVSSL